MRFRVWARASPHSHGDDAYWLDARTDVTFIKMRKTDADRDVMEDKAKTRSRRALVLIDFQNDFIQPTGRLPVAQTQVASVLNAARQAITVARATGDLVVAIGNEFRHSDYLMNLLRRNASMAGSPGAQWVRDLPLDGIPYFPKWASSAFVNSAFDRWLQAENVHTLRLTGLQAKACVTATAKDAMKRGYAVEVLDDAIACVSDRSRARALARLERRGVRRVKGLAESAVRAR